MYRLVNERAEEIAACFLGGGRAGELTTYNELMTGLRAGNVATDVAYQQRFRGFWAMRCSTGYGNAFYALMEREKEHPDKVDPVAIARALHGHPTREDKRTIQFSFATKLAHTINPRLPIYDRMVARFYFLPQETGDDAELKLAYYGKVFGFLCREYARIVRDGLLAPAIQTMRTALPALREQTDEKIIDWLIWQFVDLAERRQWFREGICRHQ